MTEPQLNSATRLVSHINEHFLPDLKLKNYLLHELIKKNEEIKGPESADLTEYQFETQESGSRSY